MMWASPTPLILPCLIQSVDGGRHAQDRGRGTRHGGDEESAWEVRRPRPGLESIGISTGAFPTY